MLRSTELHGPDKTLACIPATLENCKERETVYTAEVKGMTLAQLKNETKYLIKHEREMARKGKPLEGDADRWLMERKNALYHLIDDAERVVQKQKLAANKKWARGHDEL